MKIIITEEQFVSLGLRRNLVKLPKFIRSTYNWLNPSSFSTFEEFLERVIFSTTRDFVAQFSDESDDYLALIVKFEPMIADIIKNEFHDEILKYFNDK